MTIDEAIEILTADITYTYPAKFNKLKEAINLGLEALMEVQYTRSDQLALAKELLPGETED